MSRLKIGFMARGLNYSGSGVYTIISGLIHELSKNTYQNNVYLFTDPDQSIAPSLVNGNLHIIPIQPRTNSLIGRFVWDHYAVGRACKMFNIDVLYSPAHIKPIFTPCPTVVQVLDMMYHKFPQYWNWMDRLYFKIFVSLLTSRSTRISAISENTKIDVLRYLQIIEQLKDKYISNVSDYCQSWIELIELNKRLLFDRGPRPTRLI